MKRILALTACTAALLSGCGPSIDPHQAVFVLIDTSGTYTREIGKAQLIINYVLGSIEPGDSLAVGQVKSRSFTEKDIVAKMTIGRDPLKANQEKRAFAEAITRFAGTVRKSPGSAHTDITGGLIQAAEFLNETGAGHKTIIIFSDMEEDLDKKVVRNFPIRLDGMRIVALNVTKLETDNVDPRRYLGRLDWWGKRVMEAGAKEWRVVNDLQHLERVFDRRS